MNSEKRLIITILRNSTGEDVLEALLNAEYRVTRIASTGSFFRRGDTTLLIGTKNDRVTEAVKLIREYSVPSIGPDLKRATIFVLKVDQFEQL